MIYTKVKLQWCDLVALIDINGYLKGLWIEGQKHFPDIVSDAKWVEDVYALETSDPVYETIIELDLQLKAYMQGQLKDFNIKLSPEGTDFQKKVWSILCDIPYGETTTYGSVGKLVAKKMGLSSMAAQAIGSAVGHNPITIIIPCHRVLGRDGSLTGYAGGLDKKRLFLTLEGAFFEEQLQFGF